MGKYTCRACSDTEFKEIINLLRNGYTGKDGIKHRPNNQIADILVLEANLGCRIGDIIKLRTDSFVCDNGIWKLDIIEEKTDKKRTFIIPKPVKDFIDKISEGKNGEIFTVTEQAVWKQLRYLTKELGLTKISTHSLRKYCANNLYESTGHDIEAVCSFLQHHSPVTTRRYIRRSDEKMEKAINDIVNLM